MRFHVLKYRVMKYLLGISQPTTLRSNDEGPWGFDTILEGSNFRAS